VEVSNIIMSRVQSPKPPEVRNHARLLGILLAGMFEAEPPKRKRVESGVVRLTTLELEDPPRPA
jgi:hypothetical protein